MDGNETGKLSDQNVTKEKKRKDLQVELPIYCLRGKLYEEITIGDFTGSKKKLGKGNAKKRKWKELYKKKK